MIYGNNFDTKNNKQFLEFFIKNNQNKRDDKLSDVKRQFKEYGKIGKDNFENTFYKYDYNHQRSIKYTGDKQVEKGRKAFKTSRFKTDLPHLKKDQQMIKII